VRIRSWSLSLGASVAAKPPGRIAILAPPPLCPVGHLPLKEGDQPAATISQITTVAGRAHRITRVISPLEGEMSDRTEGGR